MKKLAIFVEGQTEQIFVKELIYQIYGYQSVSVIQEKIRGKSLFVHIKEDNDSHHFNYLFLIVNVGTDERVASAVADNASNMIAKGFGKVIGLRDLYPNTREEEPRLRSAISGEEVKILNSNGIAISSKSRVNPHGFTRPGFRILAFVLNSTISDNIIINAAKEAWRTDTVFRHVEKARIYVIEKASGLVKIGYSADVKKRIAAIRNQGGFEINRMFHSDLVPNFKQIESDLHKSFNNDRVIGEWFKADFDEVCQIIRNIEPCEEPQPSDELLYRVNMGLALWKYDWNLEKIGSQSGQNNAFAMKYREVAKRL